MAEFLEMTFNDGTTVLFENSVQDLVKPRSQQPIIEKLDPRLSQLESMARAAAGLCASLVRHTSPDDISLELGAGITGEVGWFFAKSSLDATIKITLTWKRPEQAPTSAG